MLEMLVIYPLLQTIAIVASCSLFSLFTKVLSSISDFNKLDKTLYFCQDPNPRTIGNKLVIAVFFKFIFSFIK